jgi:hypothetical protein
MWLQGSVGRADEIIIWKGLERNVGERSKGSNSAEGMKER